MARSTGRGMRIAGAWSSRSVSTMRNSGRRFATCRPYARPWTAYQIPSTACSSTAAGAAEQATGSHASRSRRRARAPSRCLSRKPRRSWISPAFRRRIRCTPGRREGLVSDPAAPRIHRSGRGAARRPMAVIPAMTKKIGISLRQKPYYWAAHEVEEARAESVPTRCDIGAPPTAPLSHRVGAGRRGSARVGAGRIGERANAA